MSKNKIAIIAAKTDSLILYCYCNHANINKTGKILMNNYNNLDDILKLIQKGNIKIINKNSDKVACYGNYTRTNKSIQRIIEDDYEANLFFYFDKEWKYFDRKFKDVIDEDLLIQNLLFLEMSEEELLNVDKKAFLKKEEFIKQGFLNNFL